MKTGYRMKTTSRKDYLQRIYQRYRRAARSKKRHILDEFCANCGYHRKYAIRLLNGPPPEAKPVRRARRPRRVSYGTRVISILQAVLESADYPWSVRLKALLPQWMPWIRRHFRLTAYSGDVNGAFRRDVNSRSGDVNKVGAQRR